MNSIHKTVTAQKTDHTSRTARGRTPFPGLSALACLALCFVVLMESRGFADPAKYPRRTVNYQPIDLMPLLLWWEKPQGVRPLVSWKHVQGIIERETIYGWVVRGTIEGKPGLQFFLMRNPPKKEIGRLRELEAMLPKLQNERASALAVSQLPAYKGWTYDLNGGTARVPSEDFDRIEQAQNNLYDIDQHIKEVRAEMATMLDTQGNIKVDAFALQLNLMYESMAVYDFGFPAN
jgi:hypothetical protein